MYFFLLLSGIDLQTSLKRLQTQNQILNLSSATDDFEEAITRFSTETESCSEVADEDDEKVPNFGLPMPVESPIWRKENAIFWRD